MKFPINQLVCGIICLFITTTSYGQGMSVNTTGSPANASAMLDVSSTSKGMLIPRMDSAQRVVISSPATGLQVYQTDGVTPGFYYNSGTPSSPTWVSLTSLSAGTNGQILQLGGGVPTWTNTTPTVTTNTVSSIGATTATCGGNVTVTGGATVTARGVCWSTTQGPTVALSTVTVNGTGIGSYTSSITGLLFGTKYYIRAYATTSAGTAYGSESTFTTGNGIGTAYGGGIIAYILQPWDNGYDPAVPHGLIAATSDLSTGIQWGCSGTVEGITSVLYGTGSSNTPSIFLNCGSGTAAYICDTYYGGGYNWYLPSRDELNKMYINQTAIGGFASAFYWSSSEYSTNYAWVVDFSDGFQTGYLKSLTTYVRAVRYF